MQVPILPNLIIGRFWDKYERIGETIASATLQYIIASALSLLLENKPATISRDETWGEPLGSNLTN